MSLRTLARTPRCSEGLVNEEIVRLLGVDMNATNGKAIHLLSWTPRSREGAIVATAESLIHPGLQHHSNAAA